jgi:glycosyltransferase involved in cell wall biosynthesis
MVLKIGVDATSLTRLNGGISYYLFHLLDELLQIKKDVLFYLYAFSDRGAIEYFLRYEHVRLRPIGFLSFCHALWSQTTLAFYCHRDQLDFFWGATQFIPLFKRKTMRCFLSLHDFAFLFYPHTVSFFRLCLQRLLSKKMCQRADAILSLSQATEAHLWDLYKLKATAVIHPPLKPSLSCRDEKETTAFLAQRGLAYGHYIVTVGTLEPRKNFAPLLEHYLALCGRFPLTELLPLILIGGGGWKNKEIIASLKSAQARYPSHIRPLGFVSEEQLSFYLSGAKHYLSFSLYEGYGMPLAEARLCGTQIAAPDQRAQREAAEEDGLFFKCAEEREALESLFTSRKEKMSPLKTTYLSNREKARKLACLFE